MRAACRGCGRSDSSLACQVSAQLLTGMQYHQCGHCTFNNVFPAHLLRMRVAANNEMTCSLCASSRIALSLDVIGFLSVSLQLNQSIKAPLRSVLDPLSHGQDYTLCLFFLSLSAKFDSNHIIVLVAVLLFLLVPVPFKVIVYTRSGGVGPGRIDVCSGSDRTAGCTGQR